MSHPGVAEGTSVATLIATVEPSRQEVKILARIQAGKIHDIHADRLSFLREIGCIQQRESSWVLTAKGGEALRSAR